MLTDYHEVSAWRESSGRPLDGSLCAVAVHDIINRTLAAATRMLGRDTAADEIADAEIDWKVSPEPAAEDEETTQEGKTGPSHAE